MVDSDPVALPPAIKFVRCANVNAEGVATFSPGSRASSALPLGGLLQKSFSRLREILSVSTGSGSDRIKTNVA